MDFLISLSNICCLLNLATFSTGFKDFYRIILVFSHKFQYNGGNRLPKSGVSILPRA